MVVDMVHSKVQRRVDKLRGLILAEILRKNYLEELLENSRSKRKKTGKSSVYEHSWTLALDLRIQAVDNNRLTFQKTFSQFETLVAPQVTCCSLILVQYCAQGLQNLKLSQAPPREEFSKVVVVSFEACFPTFKLLRADWQLRQVGVSCEFPHGLCFVKCAVVLWVRYVLEI